MRLAARAAASYDVYLSIYGHRVPASVCDDSGHTGTGLSGVIWVCKPTDLWGYVELLDLRGYGLFRCVAPSCPLPFVVTRVITGNVGTYRDRQK